MYPWDNYPQEDPRSYPMNYQTDGSGNFVYIGPPPAQLGGSGYDTSGAPPQSAYDPLSSAYQPPVAPKVIPIYTVEEPLPASTYYGGADPSMSGSQPGYVRKSVSYPATEAAPITGAPAASYPPISPVASGGVAGGGTIGMGTGQSDFITPQVPVYQGAYNAAAAAPVVAPPGVQDPLTLAPAPQTVMGGNGVPSAGALTGASNPLAPYGGPGGGSPYGGGGGMAGGYPYPSIPGAPSPTYEPMGGPPDPRGFDPFAFSGTANPMPPGSRLRGQIMQAGGFPGPAWAPAPEQPPTREMLMQAMRMGADIAAANQPQGPQPFTGMEYVARRLKLDPNGGRSF